MAKDRYYVFVVGRTMGDLDDEPGRAPLAQAEARLEAFARGAMYYAQRIFAIVDVAEAQVHWVQAYGPKKTHRERWTQTKEEPLLFDPQNAAKFEPSGASFGPRVSVSDYEWCDADDCKDRDLALYNPKVPPRLTHWRAYEIVAALGKERPGQLFEFSVFGASLEGRGSDPVLLNGEGLDPVRRDFEDPRWKGVGGAEGLGESFSKAFAPDAVCRVWMDVRTNLRAYRELFASSHYRTTGLQDDDSVQVILEPREVATLNHSAPSFRPIKAKSALATYTVPFGMMRSWPIFSARATFAYALTAASGRTCFTSYLIGGDTRLDKSGAFVQDEAGHERAYQFAYEYAGFVKDKAHYGHVGYPNPLELPVGPLPTTAPATP